MKKNIVSGSLALVTMLALTLVAPAYAQNDTHVSGTPGAAGNGDPYFPLMGNGGYDVKHYDIQLSYNPTSGAITAKTTIEAAATQNLSQFDLDFRPALHISSITVDGQPATFSHAQDQELVIVPHAVLRDDHDFTTTVTYDGVPPSIFDHGDLGWVRLPGGGMVALSQPLGLHAWVPSNDSPKDKATFDFTITVPAGFQAIANGEPRGNETHAGQTTYRWHDDQPTATELVMLTIGHFDMKTTRTHDGLPNITAIDPAAVTTPVQTATSELNARPLYMHGVSPIPSKSLVVHELAHQWYGDDVTPLRWQDVWLNEGFATYAQWLYDEQHGGKTAQQHFDELYNDPATDWTNKVADPGVDHFFDDLVYGRGAMTLHQLRLAVGDRVFMNILRQWPAEHHYGNATTQDFIAFSEHLSHKNLSKLYQTWLFTESKPAL